MQSLSILVECSSSAYKHLRLHRSEILRMECGSHDIPRCGPRSAWEKTHSMAEWLHDIIQKKNILLGLLTLDRSNHLVPRQRFKQRFRQRFRQRFTSASPTSIGRAMLEIAAQRFLVRFVRICWKLKCNGRQDQLPGVNFLHDAGTGEEEMIDAEHLHTSPPLRFARLP